MQKSVHTNEQIVLQDLLRRLRSEAGLIQSELATKLGQPQQFVSRYEVGEKMLDLPELRQVAQALGLTLIDLVTQYEAALADKKRP